MKRPLNATRIYWGSVCKHDTAHINENNRTLRYPGIGCLMCYHVYAGLTAEEIEKKTQEDFKNYVPATPEEVRRKQIQHSLNWTKRNKDRHLEHQRRYNSKISADDKKREERNERQREYYAKNREWILARNKARVERKKAEKLNKEEQE